MPIDKAFLDEIKPLYSPVMGTELVSLLLYSLVRMSRPESALEVGAGYTTPFIVKALSENYLDLQNEITKIDKVIRTKDSNAKMNIVPEYYAARHSTPVLYSIDKLTHQGTTAHKVGSLLKTLGLHRHLKLINGDFTKYAGKLKKQVGLFDFVWFDCGGYSQYVTFIDDFWPLINPNGGLLLLHSTLTNIEIREVLNQLKLRQIAKDFLNFELLSVLEPHKKIQNSVTMIRMISKFKSPTYTAGP